MAVVELVEAEPDAEAMAAHVEHLFGGFLDGYQDGMIELAWTNPVADSDGRHKLERAEFFGTDQLEDLVAKAVRLNAVAMCNVYIGAALRKPGTPPFGRGEDSDAWALPALYVDLDEVGAVAKARSLWEAADLKPTMIVQTGREPHLRAQLWWRLDEVNGDPGTWPDRLLGIALALGGDVTVRNPSRVMRLAGTIAWPVKEGRVTERTYIGKLVAGAPVYAADQLAACWPPHNAALTAPKSITLTGGPERVTGTLGFTGKVTDGRDGYMRDTVLAVMVEFIGDNGCAPTPQELFDLAWPQYEAGADLTRPGRGQKQLAEKVEYTLERFAGGRLKGLETLDQAVAVAARKKPRREVLYGGPAGGAMTDSPIKSVAFATLMSEEVVEEPDYIEPGFAGPGSFVLIAGPPKAQKSFLLQEILVAAATGGNFLGKTFTVPRPLRVFYLQAEMNRKLLRKRARELKHISPDQYNLLKTGLIVSERFHMILNSDGVSVAIQTIKEAFPAEPPDIIAVDPLANVYDEESENDNAQIMRFLTGRLEAVRQAINPLATIILVHHAAKKSTDDMARDPFVAIRGAGALRGYYDSAVVIFRQSADSQVRHIHFELRSGESPPPMLAELIDGRFIAAKKVDDDDFDMELARKMLADLKAAWDARRPWSIHSQAKTDGDCAAFNLSERYGLPEKRVQLILLKWLASNLIRSRPRKQGVDGHSPGIEVVGTLNN